MFRGLTTDLLRHGRITTTLAKAKETRGFAEKVITLAKDGKVSFDFKPVTITRFQPKPRVY